MDENELEALKEQIKNEILMNLSIRIEEVSDWYNKQIQVSLLYDGKEFSSDTLYLPQLNAE